MWAINRKCYQTVGSWGRRGQKSSKLFIEQDRAEPGTGLKVCIPLIPSVSFYFKLLIGLCSCLDISVDIYWHLRGSTVHVESTPFHLNYYLAHVPLIVQISTSPALFVQYLSEKLVLILPITTSLGKKIKLLIFCLKTKGINLILSAFTHQLVFKVLARMILLWLAHDHICACKSMQVHFIQYSEVKCILSLCQLGLVPSLNCLDMWSFFKRSVISVILV